MHVDFQLDIENFPIDDLYALCDLLEAAGWQVIADQMRIALMEAGETT